MEQHIGNLDLDGMTPEELRKYIETHEEKDYLLVDVRQPVEYTQGHIPGAIFIPLLELETKLFDLPPDKDMVFYCHSGARSLVAADLIAEAEVTSGDVFNLTGGIMAWEGKLLEGFPRVQVFDKTASPVGLLWTAMNMEKGAWRIYRHILSRYPSESFASTFDKLSQAEAVHARAIHRFWRRTAEDPLPFETVYDELEGEILEGGANFADMLKQIENFEGNTCLRLIELSLHIEYAAFDLYRTMAAKTDEPEVKSTFLSIAQAEKSHIRALIMAIPTCSK